MLNDIDPDAAAQAAAQIVAEGGRCQPFAGDVADVAFLRHMVQATVDAFGRLDMTVANAGLTHYGDFFETQPEDVDRLLGVNLRGSYFLTQASAKQMRAQGTGGRILLMASVTGIQAIRYLSAYGMTKAALRMLARNLVVELSPHKIRINAIAPGATLTPRNVDDDADFVENWSQLIPHARDHHASRTSPMRRCSCCRPRRSTSPGRRWWSMAAGPSTARPLHLILSKMNRLNEHE